MIDPFTIKPLDKKTILENARATKGRIITVEDHYHEGKQSIGGQSVQSRPRGLMLAASPVSIKRDKYET